MSNKTTPSHVGIIMDGSRAGSEERNLPPLEGIRKGYEKIKYAPDWFFKAGVKIVSVLALKVDDWQRPREEVNFLMKSIQKIFQEDIEEICKLGYKLIFSGQINDLPGDLPEVCLQAANQTKDNTNGILNICLNYDGREETLEAIRKMMKNNIQLEQVHEGMLRKYLYNSDIGDPEIVIRFADRKCLSGFLLWQTANSELVFLKKDWPDFEPVDVDNILGEYKKKLLSS